MSQAVKNAIQSTAENLIKEISDKIAQDPAFYGSCNLKVTIQAGRPQVATCSIEQTRKL